MKKYITRYVSIAREKNVVSDNPFGVTYISDGQIDNECTNLFIMEAIRDIFNEMRDEDLSGSIMKISMEMLTHNDYMKVRIEF